VAAFSRYSATLFTPDDQGDLIFNGLPGGLIAAFFPTEFSSTPVGRLLIPMFCGADFC
jgi:hypothetical protein